MNKQEQIEKMAKDLENDIRYDNVMLVHYGIEEVDIEETAKNLVANGYIKVADFVSNVAWRLADKIMWENHGRIFDLEEINQILNEALQEYLK